MPDLTEDAVRELLELLGACERRPWDWHWRDDEAAPGSIASGVREGRAKALLTCPRYGSAYFEAHAEAVTSIINAFQDIADSWLAQQRKLALLMIRASSAESKVIQARSTINRLLAQRGSRAIRQDLERLRDALALPEAESPDA